MSSRQALLAAVVILLSGCASPSDPSVAPEPRPGAIHISVPAFRAGDAWTELAVLTTERGTVTVERRQTISAERLRLTDPYGSEYPGWTLRRDEFENGTATGLAQQWFLEASRGAFVGFETLAQNMTLRAKAPSTSASGGECVYEVPSMWDPRFYNGPVGVDDGSLRGATIRIGESVARPWAYDGFPSPGATVYFNATERVRYETPSGVVEALWTTVEIVSPPSGAPPPGPLLNASERPVVRWLWGHGIPVPLRVESGGRLARELVAFHPGGEPLRFDSSLTRARLSGTHPSGTPARIGLAPDTTSIPLEFPFSQAVEALLRGPQNLVLRLWLQNHPDAYVAEAKYHPDSANRTYRWWFVFANADETYGAAAKRTVVVAEPPVYADTADSDAGPRPSDAYPKPEEVRQREFLGVGLAHDSATAFYDEPPAWSMLGWRFVRAPHPAGGREAALHYWVAPGEYFEDSKHQPLRTVMLAHGYNLNVDAAEGRVIGIRGASLMCSAQA